MDSLTHLLVGHAMGAAASGVAQPYGTAVYWAVLVGNSLPDIDVPLSLLVGRGIKLHRTITHTIPGTVILSAVAAAAISLLLPGTPFGILFGWTLMGCLSHMALDCLNLFGARLFWPLSTRAVEVGVLHILDPFLLGLLGTASLAVYFRLAPQAFLSWAFVLIWPYVACRIATARKLYWALRRAGSHRARIIPWFASWRYVFETPTAIEFGHWIRGRRQAVTTYIKLEHPIIQASLANPKVTAFLAAAEYPYALVEEDADGPAVVWGDALRQMRADFRPLRVRVEADNM
ncbi:MAG TPA: metal-dependent hydrolase [Symbiobacteriaceae bacterium]|nr:metal-dependent hydrolase [Symbiobacteriaceae bacterium]